VKFIIIDLKVFKKNIKMKNLFVLILIFISNSLFAQSSELADKYWSQAKSLYEQGK
jgi:hypothetical protein